MADEIEDDYTTLPSRPTTTAAATRNATRPNGSAAGPSRSNGPRAAPSLDRTNQNSASSSKPAVTQPKPQALPKRTGPASIIVSPRQKGNPLLTYVKSLPWEYGDIPADYLLGTTACALFLSLKYHRLHPEYIYSRIRDLKGKYNLRILLCMVDIQNHEESLRELSKTSLINSLTIVLCWSAAEGGRYLELFKTYEHASATSIKQHQSTAYADRMVDFITTPRAINKTDAVMLVSQFGTIRTAVNAREEEVGAITGFGEKKVRAWCGSVREPFRVKRAGRRGVVSSSQTPAVLSRDATREEGSGRSRSQTPASRRASGALLPEGDAERRPRSKLGEEVNRAGAFDDDDEEALAEMMAGRAAPPEQAAEETRTEVPKKRRAAEDDSLSDGVMAALSKLRKS